MIESIEIANFRCFDTRRIKGCARINLIVGENGVGKTALLEAIFLALGASPNLGIRYRQQRGMDGAFSASPRRIEEAMFRNLFFRGDWGNSLTVKLLGSGPESRSVTVSRRNPQTSLALTSDKGDDEILTGPIVFQWTDYKGVMHERVPRVSAAGVQYEGEEEELPDFFYYSSAHVPSSVENAARFSDIRQAGRAGDFVALLTSEYKWIKDLSIEVLAGAPIIYAKLDDDSMLPLPFVSGGMNRIVSVMLAIASRYEAVTLVDEIENGLYYKHHVYIWRALLGLLRTQKGQLFATTHNEEWVEALFKAAGDDVADIALWRLERSRNGPVIRRFSGVQTAAAVKAGEIR